MVNAGTAAIKQMPDGWTVKTADGKYAAHYENTTLIHNQFPELDGALSVDIRTVTPSRTFLEKAFLLNEEFQKEKPRSRRMSRHLYDLEKLMNTDYGKAALEDTALYRAIVEHRRKFYHLGYVNYDLDYPAAIKFVPEGETLDEYRRDYNDNMVKVSHMVVDDGFKGIDF